MNVLADAASRGRQVDAAATAAGSAPAGLGSYDRHTPENFQQPNALFLQQQQQDLLYRQQQEQIRLQQEREHQRERERLREQERARVMQYQQQRQTHQGPPGQYLQSPDLAPQHPQPVQKDKLTHDDVIHMSDEEILRYKPFIRPNQWKDVIDIRTAHKQKQALRQRRYEEQQRQILLQQQQREQALLAEERRRAAVLARQQQEQQQRALAIAAREQQRRSQSRGPSLPPRGPQPGSQRPEQSVPPTSQHPSVSNESRSRSKHNSNKPHLVSNASIPSLGLAILNPQAAAAQRRASVSRSPNMGPVPVGAAAASTDPSSNASSPVKQEPKQQRQQSASPSRRPQQLLTAPDLTGGDVDVVASAGPMSPTVRVRENKEEISQNAGELESLRVRSLRVHALNH